MLLAIDVGNTEIAAGVFDGERLAARARIHTEERATGDELGLVLTALLRRQGLEPGTVDGVVVANVVPALSTAVEELSRSQFGLPPLVVGPGLPTGVRILCDDPGQVGADRVANAVAVSRTRGGPAIVVDLGTATTFDALSADGDYLGGAIAPGILVSLEALASHAARLSRVELAAPEAAIGRTTQASMQAGFVYGYAALVEGMVGRMREELGGAARVVATGGLAHRMAGWTDCLDEVDEHLTLTGLRLIHELTSR